MNSTTYKLRLGDFKKLVRYILFFLSISLVSFLIFFGLIKSGNLTNEPFPPETYFVGFMLISSLLFFVFMRKNFSNEEITFDNMAIQTQRFGNIYFSDITRYRFQRHKNSEDIILTITNGMKILIGPVNSVKKDDRLIYEAFKEAILQKLPAK